MVFMYCGCIRYGVHVLWVYYIWCSCIVGVFDMVFMYCGCIIYGVHVLWVYSIWCSCIVGVLYMVYCIETEYNNNQL